MREKGSERKELAPTNAERRKVAARATTSCRSAVRLPEHGGTGELGLVAVVDALRTVDAGYLLDANVDVAWLE